MKQSIPVILVTLLAACASLGIVKFDELFGPAQVQVREVSALPTDKHLDFWTEVKPVIDNRCVVCHGCYDAPCQIKLGSPEGIDRGGSKQVVYDQARLKPAPLSRLFEDAQTTQQWREKDFYPILNEHMQTPLANRQASLMYRALQLKKRHPLPADKLLSDDFTLGIDRANTCPTADQYAKFERKNPLWGMPYALPSLSEEEQSTIQTWLEQGALHSKRPPLADQQLNKITQWEQLINGDSLKEQLVARYIYEHLFLAHVYFIDEGINTQFYRLVRSHTGPGETLDEIASRRPYSNPKVNRVYYRFTPVRETLVAKTHLPYLLDDTRENNWRTWFYNLDFEVNKLPSYELEVAGNPFKSFAQIPQTSRYRFLLDEAQFTIMNFIKGPVCRGQVALNVIRDHFWVFFVSPDLGAKPEKQLGEFTAKNADMFEMPNAKGDIYDPLSWRRYSKKQRKLLDAYDQFFKAHIDEIPETGMDIVWDGKGNNNAALTIFRHFDTATVEKGLIGPAPRTSWLIGYNLLERIHYLLVAGYDVYGNVGHQLYTRMFMDFLRMEGEGNFLMLLPEPQRSEELAEWYRGADDTVLEYLDSETKNNIMIKLGLPEKNTKKALYAQLQSHLNDSLDHSFSMDRLPLNIRSELEKLHLANGLLSQYFAETSFIQIRDNEQSWWATLLRNNAHERLTSLFREGRTLAPEENTVSIAPGLIGAYPNALFQVELSELSAFIERARSLHSEQDYQKLVDDFGIRRTNKDFWQISDQLHSALKKQTPIEYGLFDYNRLENR
ncbi:fatty acid cis/trans isomerase [Agaribacterium sp. ZY112]|uniref:fatty acid cis/trans isomerase n=1 Tax=Agaribacterium sp. ZY112 TaxID=3233574 RepID=UPI0035247FC3